MELHVDPSLLELTSIGTPNQNKFLSEACCQTQARLHYMCKTHEERQKKEAVENLTKEKIL